VPGITPCVLIGQGVLNNFLKFFSLVIQKGGHLVVQGGYHGQLLECVLYHPGGERSQVLLLLLLLLLRLRLRLRLFLRLFQQRQNSDFFMQ
jgi:hypothetical protein